MGAKLDLYDQRIESLYVTSCFLSVDITIYLKPGRAMLPYTAAAGQSLFCMQMEWTWCTVRR